MSRFSLAGLIVPAVISAVVVLGFNVYVALERPALPTAQPQQANSWVYTCAQLDPSDDAPGVAQVACLGYLRAFVDMHNVMATLATGLEHPTRSDISLMCAPRDVKAGQLYKDVDRWVASNPNRVLDIEQTYTDSNRAFALVVAALNETYPCEASE